MTEVADQSDQVNAPTINVVQSMKIAVMEMAAHFVVRRVLDSGFRHATGHAPPTARDRSVPLRRAAAWAAVTAGSVAAANVLVDRLVLRPKAPSRMPTCTGAGPGRGS